MDAIVKSQKILHRLNYSENFRHISSKSGLRRIQASLQELPQNIIPEIKGNGKEDNKKYLFNIAV